MREILECVTYPGYEFVVMQEFSWSWLQGRYWAEDVDTGVMALQSTRKWVLSSHMTRSELVQTCLKLVLTSLEHRGREGFLYKGRRVFGPHFDVEQLWEIADGPCLDARR